MDLSKLDGITAVATNIGDNQLKNHLMVLLAMFPLAIPSAQLAMEWNNMTSRDDRKISSKFTALLKPVRATHSYVKSVYQA